MKAQRFALFLYLFAVGVIDANLAMAADEDQKAVVSPQRALPTYDELAALRAENAVLKAKLENAELRSKIEASKTGPAAGSVSLSTGRSRSAATVTVDRGARVQMVSGVGGNLVATILLSDGANAIARVGMRIPNLGRVKSIKTDEVLVEIGKETISIPFAMEPVSNTQYSSQYAPPSFPGAAIPPLSLPPGRN